MMRRYIALLTFILLVACTAVPKSPAQTVFLAESNYEEALRIEILYSKLPRCSGNVVLMCSKVSIIKTLQKSDNAAWDAIQAAQVAVRTPGFGENASATAVISATALTNAFMKITETLGVR